MPWSGPQGSQSFSRTDGISSGTDTWQQAAAAGRGIEADDHDTHDQDIATGLNAVLKKDGGNTATADIPMGGFKLTNVGAAAARTDFIRFSQAQDGAHHYIATVGGTADAITLTPSIAITAYAAGQRFCFIAGGTNTGATTVNVSAVGAKDIKRNDGSATALSAGDIVSGSVADIEYDGTRFLLLSRSGVSAATQAEQEAGSSTSVMVTPGRQHFHPGMVKAWGMVTLSGGTPTLAAGYNIGSVTDNGVGNFSPQFTNALSSTNYAVIATIHFATPTAAKIIEAIIISRATGSFNIGILEEAGGGTNADFVDVGFAFAVLGDI